MSDSLGNILGSKKYGEPPELQLIKDFVHEEVGLIPAVRVTTTHYIVTLPSAAAAGTLRFRLFQLQRRLGHQKKIILKIGQV